MSVQPNNNDPYCDPSDVARYFRTLEDEDGFSFDTNPSESEVKEFILEASARVDRETGHAWRARKVANEYHDLDGPYYYWAGRPLKLMKREIRTPLDSSEGDKLEIYDGNQWVDWVTDSTKQEGRNEEYWVNSTDGVLHIFRRGWWNRYKSIRVSYRYGGETVPKDVQQATALYTAAALIETDVYGDLLPTGGNDAPSPRDVAERLEERSEKLIDRRREVRQVGGP